MSAARLLAAALAAAALACGSGEKAPTSGAPPAAPPSTAPAAAPPPAPAPTPAPAPAATPTAKHDPARGAPLYATYCASCHGARGDADGPLAASLDPHPAKHSDGARMNALTNAYLFQVIKEGGASVGKSPLMAPWGGTLGDEQIWDVVAYVRTLAKPPYTGPLP